MKINNRASILILTLWVMAFLGIFAVQIGLGIRQRIALISRLEARSQLRFLGESGIKKALAVLMADVERNQLRLTQAGKQNRFNNPEDFKAISLNHGKVNVAYEGEAEFLNKSGVYYGFVDEDRKLNINTASVQVMTALFTSVLGDHQGEARDKAEAIIAWREIGETTLDGFSSNSYYKNLEHAYALKNAWFETLDELTLVKGFDSEMVTKLRSYVTVYGDGRININTVSGLVLSALGLNDALLDKIDLVRRGADGLESTEDDFVFGQAFDIISNLLAFTDLEVEEVKALERLNQTGVLKTDSRYYLIVAHSQLRQMSLTTSCVFNILEQRVEYWREKY